MKVTKLRQGVPVSSPKIVTACLLPYFNVYANSSKITTNHLVWIILQEYLGCRTARTYSIPLQSPEYSLVIYAVADELQR
jgi:hypothetical protein